MRIRWMNRMRGFTLIELMIVVAIIGVLAAVAIPVMSSYIKKSKASEAYTVLQGIREKEEAYFGEFKRYTADLDWRPAGACGDCMSDTRPWELDDGTAEANAWLELGFAPDGPTYYQYMVDSPFDTDGVFSSGDARPDNVGTTWPTAKRPWFVAQACGDIDCDGEIANFYVSSENKAVYHDGEENSIY